MAAEATHHPELPPLKGRRFSPATKHSADLLSSLGAEVVAPTCSPLDAQAAWAQSGAMWLTGRSDGPPLPCPAPLAARMQGAYLALQTLAPQLPQLDASALLGERAAISGLQRQGAVCPGGSCRLLAAADGWLAVNLPRDDDWSLLPALLAGASAQDWQSLSVALKHFTVAELCEQGRLLGLAIAPARGEPCDRKWFEIAARGPRQRSQHSAPLVIDLSSLWAGPLCAHLLQQSGARVIKVESRSRPDGARRGPADFFHLLNAGKASVALDLPSPTAVDQLRALIDSADIVIESSRPRALKQMGIVPEELVASRPGLTWVSITGYGRSETQAMRIAYGDDAAVAAGLSESLFRQFGDYLFCGDAIADPLTGVHAALAALAGWQSGGGYLFDIALQAVVASCLSEPALPCSEVVERSGQWFLKLDDRELKVAPPRARALSGLAPELGADTDTVLKTPGGTC